MWGDSFNAISSPGFNRSVGYLTTNKPNSSFNFLYQPLGIPSDGFIHNRCARQHLLAESALD